MAIVAAAIVLRLGRDRCERQCQGGPKCRSHRLVSLQTKRSRIRDREVKEVVVMRAADRSCIASWSDRTAGRADVAFISGVGPAARASRPGVSPATACQMAVRHGRWVAQAAGMRPPASADRAGPRTWRRLQYSYRAKTVGNAARLSQKDRSSWQILPAGPAQPLRLARFVIRACRCGGGDSGL